MIKQNDTATITLLLLISLVALIYALMFFYTNTAEAFIARLGGDFAQQGESGYFWMRQIGIIYVALAIGNIIALMATPEQCTVYFRAMLVLTFFAFMRALWITMTVEGGTNNLMPLISQGLVWLGFLIIYSRSGQRSGSNVLWF